MRSSLYLPLGLSVVLTVIQRLLEYFAQEQTWWHRIPFGYLIAGGFVFAFGVLVNDLASPCSSVRKTVRGWRKVFDVVALYSGHVQADPERVTVQCLIKFTHAAPRGELLITVTPELLGRPAAPFVVRRESLNVVQHADMRLTICSLRAGKTPIHSLWGEEVGSKDIKPGQRTVTPHSRNVVCIEVKSGWHRQRFQFLVHALDDSRLDARYVYLQREGDELLAALV